MNFSSPKHLSEYLKTVSNDKTLYNSYFKWKNKYCIKEFTTTEYLCKICEHLRSNSNEKKFSDRQKMTNWWTNESNYSRMVFQNEVISLARSEIKLEKVDSFATNCKGFNYDEMI